MPDLVLGIDPGQRSSGWIVYDAESESIVDLGYHDNVYILREVIPNYSDGASLAIEMVANYMTPVGASVFETCVWIGRFAEMFGLDPREHDEHFVFRNMVIIHHCGQRYFRTDNGTKSFSDADVKRALVERFGGDAAYGGTNCPKCKGEGLAGRAVCPGCKTARRCSCYRKSDVMCDECCRVCEGGRNPEVYAKVPCEECSQTGWKTPPGPLFEMTKYPRVNSHIFQALGVATCWAERRSIC